MDENNVMLGQIRLEEAFDEAKISEPDTFYFARPIDYVDVAHYDAYYEGKDLRLIPESRKNIGRYKVVREG